VSSRRFCELHLHLEGTLEPELIFALARRKGISLPYKDVQDLKRRYAFTDLQSFLDLYYANMAVLSDEEDFYLLTCAYLDKAAASGIAHVEMFIDPQAHSARGVPEHVVLAGVHRAIQDKTDHNMSAAIIICVLRDQTVPSARRMLDAVLETGIPVLGIGLDSAEVGFPPSLFAEVFEHARAVGLRRVAHAGEEGPPDYIWQALDILGAERIDHGVRALEDRSLIQRLVQDEIPLTICPLSNVRLRVVENLNLLPLRQMLDEGLKITINSDDPAYFGGYLDDNISAITTTLQLNGVELNTLAQNSIEASFINDQNKRKLSIGFSGTSG
jgi:adenosine deaminase